MISLKPGLYQVRVVARDTRSGRLGGVYDWIEIPDLTNQKLALSSLLAGAHINSQPAAAPATANTSVSVPMSFDRRFDRDSLLRYLIFVYNSTVAPGQSADLAVQTQILRDDQPVITTPLRKITIDATKDVKSLPYAAELSLAGLPSGSYILLVNVIDRSAGNSASQRMRFEIK